MDKDQYFQSNIEKGAKELLNFLKRKYPSYNNVVREFFTSLLNEKNERFMKEYNDYDPTSFVQFDTFMDIFSEHCKKNLPLEIIKEYKLKSLIQELLNIDEIILLRKFKNLDTEFIIHSIQINNFLSESYYNNLFTYHMGYNDSYEVYDVIKKLISHLLRDEEMIQFNEFKEKIKKEHEDKMKIEKAKRDLEEREFYLKKRNEKMSKKLKKK